MCSSLENLGKRCFKSRQSSEAYQNIVKCGLLHIPPRRKDLRSQASVFNEGHDWNNETKDEKIPSERGGPIAPLLAETAVLEPATTRH